MAIRIDLSGDEIVLENLKPHLRSHHFAQIKFWAFRLDEAQEDISYRAPFTPAVLLKLLNYLKLETIPIELSRASELVVEKLEEHHEQIKEIKTEADKFKRGKSNPVVFKKFRDELRNCVTRPLKSHQERAAFHLALVGNAANFSVPGSGKTAVVLSVYEMLRRQGKVNRLLVVGPPACFSPWKREFESTLGRKPNSRLFVGGNRQDRKSSYYAPPEQLPELCLTTYQTLLNDQEELSFMLRQDSMSIFLVVDEAHYIKQLEGNWACAVLKVATLAKYRCVLTGTPMPRSYSDLFNLFDFLWLDDSPLSVNLKVSVQESERAGHAEEASQLLKDAIGPLFYRVPKSELGLSQPIFHEPIVVKMNPLEQAIYDAIIHRIRSYAETDYLKDIDLVLRLQKGRMIRLRQCVSNVALLRSAVEDYDEDISGGDSKLADMIVGYRERESPAKLEALKQLVRRLAGSKLIIWTNFIGTIKWIETSLRQEGYSCKSIFGAVPIESTRISDEETREQIIAEFLNPKSELNILIANPAACAESISLHTTCQHAVYYDLSYNCAQYLQSLDRIHRVGGSELISPHYYFLQYKGTLDEDIKANLEAKTKKMMDLIEGELRVCSLDMFDESGDSDAYKRLFQQTT